MSSEVTAFADLKDKIEATAEATAFADLKDKKEEGGNKSNSSQPSSKQVLLLAKHPEVKQLLEGSYEQTSFIWNIERKHDRELLSLIGKGLNVAKNIRKCWISGVMEDIVVLAGFLVNNRSLESLELNFVYNVDEGIITDEGIIALARIIPQMRLRSLELTFCSFNKIGEKAFKALMEVLTTCPSLLKFRLENLRILGKNTMDLVESLKQNTGLAVLNLINVDEEDGFGALRPLAEAIAAHPRLRVFNFNSISLSVKRSVYGEQVKDEYNSFCQTVMSNPRIISFSGTLYDYENESDRLSQNVGLGMSTITDRRVQHFQVTNEKVQSFVTEKRSLLAEFNVNQLMPVEGKDAVELPFLDVPTESSRQLTTEYQVLDQELFVLNESGGTYDEWLRKQGIVAEEDVSSYFGIPENKAKRDNWLNNPKIVGLCYYRSTNNRIPVAEKIQNLERMLRERRFQLDPNPIREEILSLLALFYWYKAKELMKKEGMNKEGKLATEAEIQEIQSHLKTAYAFSCIGKTTALMQTIQHQTLAHCINRQCPPVEKNIEALLTFLKESQGMQHFIELQQHGISVCRRFHLRADFFVLDQETYRIYQEFPHIREPFDRLKPGKGPVWIVNKPISVDAMRCLCHDLNEHRVPELYLKYCQIDDAAVMTLVKHLDDYQRIIKLTNNVITDEGAKALAAMLRRKKNLEELDLDNNAIGDIGCVALADALRDENHTLRHLYLNNNPISDEGLSRIVNTLKKQNNLQRLNLSGISSFTDKGLEYLATMLRCNQSLSRLCLKSPKNNPVLSSDSVLKFVDALDTNYTLVVLSIDLDSLDPEMKSGFEARIKKILERNKSLFVMKERIEDMIEFLKDTRGDVDEVLERIKRRKRIDEGQENNTELLIELSGALLVPECVAKYKEQVIPEYVAKYKAQAMQQYQQLVKQCETLQEFYPQEWVQELRYALDVAYYSNSNAKIYIKGNSVKIVAKGDQANDQANDGKADKEARFVINTQLIEDAKLNQDSAGPEVLIQRNKARLSRIENAAMRTKKVGTKQYALRVLTHSWWESVSTLTTQINNLEKALAAIPKFEQLGQAEQDEQAKQAKQAKQAGQPGQSEQNKDPRNQDVKLKCEENKRQLENEIAIFKKTRDSQLLPTFFAACAASNDAGNSEMQHIAETVLNLWVQEASGAKLPCISGSIQDVLKTLSLEGRSDPRLRVEPKDVTVAPGPRVEPNRWTILVKTCYANCKLFGLEPDFFPEELAQPIRILFATDRRRMQEQGVMPQGSQANASCSPGALAFSNQALSLGLDDQGSVSSDSSVLLLSVSQQPTRPTPPPAKGP